MVEPVTETTTILNPSRPQVQQLVMSAMANQDETEDSAQIFADLLMATAQIAYMGGIETTGIQQMFESAMPNAKTAGDYLINHIEGLQNGG